MKKVLKRTITRNSVVENNEIKQLIIGSVLGDGYLEKLDGNPNKNSRLSIAHTKVQKEYCEFKHNILKKYDLAGKIAFNENIKSAKIKIGFGSEYRFKSKAHPIFTKYRNFFYLNNKKLINRQIVEQIDEFGIAIWFMDDGSYRGSGYLLCTNCFTKEDCEYLINMLYYNFDIKSSYQNYDGSIYIWKESIKTFNKIVEPYIVDCMKYKLIRTE